MNSTKVCVLAGLCALLIIGCGDDDDDVTQYCVPGTVQECPCGDGVPDGTQVCLEDSSGWGDCECSGDTDVDSDTDADGDADEDELNYGNQHKAWTPRLLRAAYNYQYVSKDPGAFAHNGRYVIQILYDALEDIGTQVTVDMAGMVRPEGE